jgi:hypothetical protein
MHHLPREFCNGDCRALLRLFRKYRNATSVDSDNYRAINNKTGRNVIVSDV